MGQSLDATNCKPALSQKKSLRDYGKSQRIMMSQKKRYDKNLATATVSRFQGSIDIVPLP